MFSFLLISEGMVRCQHISCVHGLFCYVSFRQIDILSIFIDVNKIICKIYICSVFFFQITNVSWHIGTKPGKWAVMYLCLRIIEFAPTYDYLLDLRTVPTMWYFFFIFIVCFHGEVYSIQHYLIKFVSKLGQVSSFLWVFRFSPPIKQTVTK